MPKEFYSGASAPNSCVFLPNLAEKGFGIKRKHVQTKSKGLPRGRYSASLNSLRLQKTWNIDDPSDTLEFPMPWWLLSWTLLTASPCASFAAGFRQRGASVGWLMPTSNHEHATPPRLLELQAALLDFFGLCMEKRSDKCFFGVVSYERTYPTLSSLEIEWSNRYPWVLSGKSHIWKAENVFHSYFLWPNKQKFELQAAHQASTQPKAKGEEKRLERRGRWGKPKLIFIRTLSLYGLKSRAPIFACHTCAWFQIGSLRRPSRHLKTEASSGTMMWHTCLYSIYI